MMRASTCSDNRAFISAISTHLVLSITVIVPLNHDAGKCGRPRCPILDEPARTPFAWPAAERVAVPALPVPAET
jgi:hypothetical protein